MRSKARDPRIELRVGKPTVAGEVNGCDLVRRATAEMRDPVVIANRRHASSRKPPDHLPVTSGSLLVFSRQRSGTPQQFADHVELVVAKLDHIAVLDRTIVRRRGVEL